MDPIETFNNLPPEQQQEIIKQGLKAVDKLSKGLGKLFGYFFDDKYMKKMADAEAYKEKVLADAKAYEINTIGEAIRNNKDLPIKLSSIDNTLSVDITNTEQLIQRSNLRLQYQQAKKQQNIESVIGKTVLELGDKTVDTTEEIDEDWFIRYFKIVEDISDEDMQNLWARILAGEILRPKTNSLRLLDFLKNTSKDDFNVLLKILPFISEKYIIRDLRILQKYGISYELILRLDEWGVLNSDGLTNITTKLDVNSKTEIFQTKNLILIAKNNFRQTKEMRIPVFSVTEIGLGLLNLAETSLNLDFFRDAITAFSKDNKNITFSLHLIKSRNDDSSTYELNPIFEITN